QQVQVLDDPARREREEFLDQLGDLVLGDDGGVLGAHGDRHRLGHTDRIRQLHLGAAGQARLDDVLGDVAAHVAGAAVDLARVLAAERPTAVRAATAVAVDDDLAAGQAGVTVRAADDELSGRVDVEDDVVVP